MYEFESEHEQEIFEYLDKLRESGETNMYGASSYIMEEFGDDKHQASRFLHKWMETFSERHEV